ncbi:hypothetical protein [Corynebacterium sp. NML130628]|uniref:hypothetical protein n=1 Tax=Corynebacterium sp. NML130628 TaxID=1906333 RepID=UPI0008FB5DC6|nr:hypothetical protein [Corynebacterium sp. NML130628]OIR46103.1 hypothetical protein BJP07_01970 [Corynebacterium sp. NML130628]
MRIDVLAALALGCVALAGCSTGKSTDLGFAAAAQDGTPFTVSQVVGDSAERAYLFCPYTDKAQAEALGFDPDDVYSINDNAQRWETWTGIGVIFSDDRTPAVEWFDPSIIDACPGATTGDELDVNAPITPTVEPVEFAGDEEPTDVIKLVVE